MGGQDTGTVLSSPVKLPVSLIVRAIQFVCTVKVTLNEFCYALQSDLI